MFRKNIITLLLSLLLCTSLQAGWINLSPTRIGSSGTGCTSFDDNDEVRNYDPNYQFTVYGSSSYYDATVVNRVILGINRDCIGPFTGMDATMPYTLEVDLVIEYVTSAQVPSWTSNSAILGLATCPSCSKTTVSKTLKIKYDPTFHATETEMSVFNFSGAYDVKVIVDEIRVNGTTVTDAPQNAYIENVMAIERYRNLNLSPSSSLSFTTDPTLPDEKLLVTIGTPVTGAESYDIEWLFLDWYSGSIPGADDGGFAFDFSKDATRVTVKSLSFTLPIIYPRGVLLFRFRANGVNVSDITKTISTPWIGTQSGSISVDVSGPVNISPNSSETIYGYYLVGYNNGYNWQHSVSFAEQGKYKQVISYYDGSLYNRQSITRNNTENKAIVGQTVYDFHGRPAIQILPAPVPSSTAADQNLLYKADFNQTNAAARSGENYNWLDFDPDNTSCTDTKTAVMYDNSGTAKYYSPNNPLSTTNKEQIPDAQGYAFTQTEFMPDNTGRVRRQGGVGPAHRLTGDDESGTSKNGKETKYYYGVPNQQELYRLFGNEVGKAERYKKNIVVDPNGQVSISYIDPMGRVIATALAGSANNSPNMTALASAGSTETIVIDLIAINNKKNYTDLKITSQYDKTIYNETSTEKFWYKLSIPMLEYVCDENEFCFDCVYNLELSIKDLCGTELVPSQYRSQKVGITTDPHTCGDTLVFSTDNTYFVAVMDPGEYVVTRTLTIDKEKMEEYWQEVLASVGADCIKPYADLLVEEKAKLDYTACDYDCAQCLADADALTDPDEKAAMLLQCDALCKKTTPCDALYEQMIADLSPGGQYFDDLEVAEIEDALAHNTLEENEIDPTPPTIIPSNSWLEANDDPHVTYFFGPLGDGDGGVFTDIIADPDDLIKINDWDKVRKYWKDEFAPAMIRMHPEHCIYQKCTTINESYLYDQVMLDVQTASEAISTGFYNPTDMTITGYTFPNPSNRDPFFYGAGSGYKGGIEAALADITVGMDHYEAWQLVDHITEEQGSDIAGCLSDYGWMIFRSIYLAKKKEQVDIYYQNLGDGCIDEVEETDYSRRFPFGLEYDFGASIPTSADPDDYRDFVNAEIEENCAVACSAYVEQWRRELAGCDPLEIDDIIDRMLEVCQAGCDWRDPMGTRAAKPGKTTTSGVVNFREAIGGEFVEKVCDDLLVSWPRGNYNDYWVQATPYVNRCGCLPGQEAPDPEHSCSSCGGGFYPNAQHIYNNITLADQEKCKNCITCVNLATGLKELDILYDEEFSLTETDGSDNSHRILENYFNQKFSFNLTYFDYVEFMRQCAGEELVDENTVADFRTAMYDFVNPVQPVVSSFTILEESGNFLLDTTEEEFLIDTLEFGGGMPLAAFIPPMGYAPLDYCACNKLLDAELALNAYNDENQTNITFQYYMDNTFAVCEGDWGDHVDELLQTCKNAISKGKNNDTYTSGSFTWNTTQLQNLNQFVKRDFNKGTSVPLMVPAGCACAPVSFPPPPVVIINNEPCDDCRLKALEEYLSFLDQCLPGGLQINGAGVSVQDMIDYITQPWPSAVHFRYNEETSQNELVKTTSNCDFVFGIANFPFDIGTTNYSNFSPDCHIGISYYLQKNGCYTNYIPPTPCTGPNCPPPICPGCHHWEQPPNDWPFSDPPQFCNACYKPDYELLTGMLDFMNELSEPDIPSEGEEGGNILVADGWLTSSLATSYALGALYDGSCGTNLTYEITSWQPGEMLGDIPYIAFTVSDASGGGGCTHITSWTLSFPEYNDEYMFGFITDFLEIIPIRPQYCGDNTHSFKVKVRILASSGSYFEVWINGTVLEKWMYSEDPSKCLKLCNKPVVPVLEALNTCMEMLDSTASRNANDRYEEQILALKADFEQKYIEKCMGAYDVLRNEYVYQEYHFTLYYYDQADNLIKTVPPKGVMPLNTASRDSAEIYWQNTGSNTRIKPNHNYITQYKYNTLNQLTEQTTPDAGTSRFWYDRLGRIVLSQNAKQAVYTGGGGEKRYSYTQYDRLGRILEAGEVLLEPDSVTPERTAGRYWAVNNLEACTTKTQITRTVYDKVPAWAPAISGFTPANLRNRVVGTFYYDTYQPDEEDYNHATWYSYDVLGNVYHLVQDVPALADMGNNYKHLEYNYDLASGNVNLVSYQRGQADQFFHYYQYDADNRITAVYTSRRPAVNELDMARSLPDFIPGTGWYKDAKYLYYLHGPLARTEYGQHIVQGTDYTYTLHGWLKAVNSGMMQPTLDPGKDGYTGGSNRYIGRDAMGLELGYYYSSTDVPYNDYTPILTSTAISTKTSSDFKDATTNLYNGNISYTVTTVPDAAAMSSSQTMTAAPLGAVHSYDQLNRLKETVQFTNANTGTNAWQNNYSAGYKPQPWQMRLDYDAMGNITNLVRHGGPGSNVAMDSLTYYYDNANWNNQLLYVDDIIGGSSHTEDIDDQAGGNYDYDEIGNLVSDAAEQIASIEWTVYGKIKSLTRTGGSTKPNLEFEYNTAGQRIIKRVLPNNGDKPETEYYIRDAGGNIMAIYKHYYEITNPDVNGAEERLEVGEYELYGSSRLGMLKDKTITAYRVGVYSGGSFTPSWPYSYTVATLGSADILNYTTGYKSYELTNHLGNVQATVTDRKIPVMSGSAISYFNPQVTTITDYFPFGQQIEERSYAVSLICAEAAHYDTIPSTQTTFSTSLFIFSALSPGESINMDGLPVVFYNPDPMHSASDYALDLAIALNGMSGFNATASGPSVNITVDISIATQYNCGDLINFTVGFSSSASIYIDCSPTYVYVPADGCFEVGGYRFGFNGQEKDDEVSGEGNSNTAEYWQYDTRLGRRWNVDPVIVYYESGYAVFRNTPINLSDPNGDNPGDPVNRLSLSSGLSATFNLGKNGGLNLSLFAGGVYRTPYMQWGLNVSGNFYGGAGTPGTSPLSSRMVDVTLSPSITVGGGQGTVRELNTFNSFSGSGVTTSYATSVSIGQNFTWSYRSVSESGYSRMQRTSFAGFTLFNAFSAGSYNDVERFPFFGDGKDEFWSAGINAAFHLKSGFSVSWITDLYYGKSNNNGWPSQGDDDWIDGMNYDNQSPLSRSLNSPMETINVTFPRGMFYGGNSQVMLGIGRTGLKAMWPSNKMHDHIPDPHDGSLHFHHLQVLRPTRPVIRKSINYYENMFLKEF